MKRRYLVITELFLPTKGGTAVWFDEVYRRLGDKTTHVVTADVQGAMGHDHDHPNTIHRLNLQRVPWLRPESLLMYVRLFLRSFWLATREHFTAIHAGRALPEGMVALIVARLTFHPVVIYAHGEELTTWGKGRKYKAMRFALRHADRVIANSEFTKAELFAMGVDPERISLIYPGVDLERFYPGLDCDDLKANIGLKAGEKLILSVGRLSRRKGFDMVIQALSVLKQEKLDARYVLIGMGEDRDYLADLAAKSGVEDRVHLLGHVSPEDLPRWYNACDVFAMPNREIDGDTEGFGMVFIEAAACGKTSIAGAAGGTGAAVLDGKTGRRVNGGKLDEIVEAMREILNNPVLSASLSSAAFDRARKEFGWNNVAEKTNRLHDLF